ncbi:unnamed protein product, partial [Effrenium voratum]
QASKDSIRGLLFQHWKDDCGLSQQPTTMDNGVHFSAGALEGMRERMLWTNAELSEDSLGRLLLSSGVPENYLEEWMKNPWVDGWHVGTKRVSGPLFAVTEDCDTVTFRDSAIRYLREKGVGLHCWTIAARQILSSSGSGRWTTETSGGEKPKKMTILHFNDVYNVEGRVKEPVGGIARFVTRIRELKAESMARGEHEAVVLFSGDAFNPSLMSTSTYGKHMVKALNAVGIHTACYGNHDFDFGVDQLEELAAQNNFPWLISNVSDKKTGRPLANGIVTRVMDFHGRKVGLIGLVEKEWLVTLATINPSEVDYEDFVPCARRLAKQLKEQERAEIVIALTHMRVPNDELLAHEVPEVDIILGGHDHHYDVKPVGPHGTFVLKSGTDFRDITVLQLEFTDGASKPFQVTEHHHVEVDSKIAEDLEMKGFVDECMGTLGAAMDKLVGATAVDLDSTFASIRTKETNIGNFITDIMRFALKADVAVLNSGTIRADAIIEKGDIKVRDLVNLLPMLDELCLLQLTGAQLLNALENSVSQYPRLEGRFLQVSGVSFSFDAKKEPNKRILEGSVKIGAEPLVMDKNYKVCTKDYLRQGKDGFDVLKESICLADGETAGILPSVVRDCFSSLDALNGESDTTKRSSTEKSMRMLEQLRPVKVGDGPEMLRRYAINPAVEDFAPFKEDLAKPMSARASRIHRLVQHLAPKAASGDVRAKSFLYGLLAHLVIVPAWVLPPGVLFGCLVAAGAPLGAPGILSTMGVGLGLVAGPRKMRAVFCGIALLVAAKAKRAGAMGAAAVASFLTWLVTRQGEIPRIPWLFHFVSTWAKDFYSEAALRGALQDIRPNKSFLGFHPHGASCGGTHKTIYRKSQKLAHGESGIF